MQLVHKSVLEAVASGAATRDKDGNVGYSVVFGDESPEHMHNVTDEKLTKYAAKLVSDADRAIDHEIYSLEGAKITLGEDFPSKGQAKLDKLIKDKVSSERLCSKRCRVEKNMVYISGNAIKGTNSPLGISTY